FIDCQELQALSVPDPHGLGVHVEHQAICVGCLGVRYGAWKAAPLDMWCGAQSVLLCAELPGSDHDSACSAMPVPEFSGDTRLGPGPDVVPASAAEASCTALPSAVRSSGWYSAAFRRNSASASTKERPWLTAWSKSIATRSICEPNPVT